MPVTIGNQAWLIAEEMSKFDVERTSQMISSFKSFKEEVMKLLQFTETKMKFNPGFFNADHKY
jgi:hypothetical protein